MDAEAVRKKRQDALNEKRARLEQMRRQREQRAARKADPDAGKPKDKEEVSKSRAEVDDLVNSLLKGGLTGTKTSVDDSAVPPVVGSVGSEEKTLAGGSTSTAAAAGNAKSEGGEPVIRYRPVLSFVKSVVSIDVPPSQSESYDKEAQTDMTGEDMDQHHLEGTHAMDSVDGSSSGINSPHSHAKSAGRRPLSLNMSTTPGAHARTNGSPTSRSRSMSRDLAAEVGSEAGGRLSTGGEGSLEKDGGERDKKKGYSEEDVVELTHREDFKQFLDSSGRVMERILGAGSSSGDAVLFRDYASNTQVDLDHAVLTARGGFSDKDGWLALRAVHDIQSNPHYPELVAVAYGDALAGGTGSGGSRHRGGVAVWSYALHQRPEFRFAAPAPVLVVRFHPFDTHLVIGGCDNGLVVVWDMRAPKPEPVLISSLSGNGHKYPIRAMCVVGSGVNHELVSTSSDGMVCHWDLTATSLSEPTRWSTAHCKSTAPTGGRKDTSTTVTATVEPVHLSHVTFDKGTSSCPHEIRRVFMGTQAGTILESTVPLANEVTVLEQQSGHGGTVTGMHIHPRHDKGLADLLLTSSVDWTVKLWSASGGNTDSDTGKAFEPLLEFRNRSYDYVVDVAWSPINPTLFATITSGCELVLWNITRSCVDASCTFKVASEQDDDKLVSARSAMAGGSRLPPRTLNRLAWAADGRRVLVGDNRGQVCIVAVAESEAVPVKADGGRFDMAVLMKSRAAGMDEEEDDVVVEAPEAARGGKADEDADKGEDGSLSFMREVATPTK